MKLRHLLALTLCAGILGALAPACSWGEEVGGGELTIQDTTGFTRASSQLEGPGKIEFSVIGSGGEVPSEVPLTLTNKVTGETISATAHNGVATFESVNSGAWTISTTTPGVTFTNVVISGAEIGTAVGTIASSTLLIAGGGLVAAGGVTAVAVDASHHSKKDPHLSPSS